MSAKADMAFINGQVVTVNEQSQVVEALAVQGNTIAHVGATDEINSLIGPNTKVFDLQGRTLLPGFIDSHFHMAIQGTNELGLNCRFPNVKSIEDLKQMIRRAAENTSPGQWIRGWGYDQSKLAEKRHPIRWDLDEVAPDNPVILTRTCGHISTNNSRSLELGGINDNTPDPQYGVIERIDGKPTGVLKEMAHMHMVKVSAFSEQELIDAFSLVDKQLSRLGITSVHEAGCYGSMQMRAMQKAVEQGCINTRIYAFIYSSADNLAFVQNFLKSGFYTGFGNDKLRLGPLKVMIDGSSSGPTAATRKPYSSNPEDSGIICISQETLDDIVLRAHRAGFQVTAHAVGDRAVEMMVDSIEYALKDKPRNNHRHRIEHCAIVDPDLINRIKHLGIVPIPQPVFYYEFGDGYLANYGAKRVRYMFPCKSFIENSIIAAASSDCPVTFPDPIFGIHLAVNRITQENQAPSPQERVSIMEAIKLYTINGAFASFEENIKGSLEPGKLADLTVLSEPILDCASERIKNVKVTMTIIDGKVEFEG